MFTCNPNARRRALLEELCHYSWKTGTGKLMQMGSIRLISEPGSDLSLVARIASNLGLGLKTTGNGLFLAGKYVFLSIAVPTYTIAWLITQGFPKVANLIHQYVIVPIFRGIVQAARFLNNSHYARIIFSRKIFNS